MRDRQRGPRWRGSAASARRGNCEAEGSCGGEPEHSEILDSNLLEIFMDFYPAEEDARS